MDQTHAKKQYPNKKRKFYNKKKKTKYSKSDSYQKSNNGRTSNLKSSNKVKINWINLTLDLIETRSKYFSTYFRETKNKKKIANKYHQLVAKLSNFERLLPAPLLVNFKKLKITYPEDIEYSSNKSKENNDSISQENIQNNASEKVSLDNPDFHYLTSQKSHDYKNDRKESTGSMQDYKKLKEN